MSVKETIHVTTSVLITMDLTNAFVMLDIFYSLIKGLVKVSAIMYGNYNINT